MCSVRCFPLFFTITATSKIYTLSLHDALPILAIECLEVRRIDTGDSAIEKAPAFFRRTADDLQARRRKGEDAHRGDILRDRKSTRLNSSHANISYAVFCLKKKKKKTPYI